MYKMAWVLLVCLVGCGEESDGGDGVIEPRGSITVSGTVFTCDLAVMGQVCRNNASCGVCDEGGILSGYQRSDECRWDWQWSAGGVVGYGSELELRCVEQDGPLNTRTDLR